ncbi:hypothetical protein ACSAZK_08475 [Methanosarcina sp. Mfa9]
MFFGKGYKQSIGKLRAIIPQEVTGGAFRKMKPGLQIRQNGFWEK